MADMRVTLYDKADSPVVRLEPKDELSPLTIIHHDGVNYVYRGEDRFREAQVLVLDDYGQYDKLKLMPVSDEEWNTLENLREGHAVVNVVSTAEDYNDDIVDHTHEPEVKAALSTITCAIDRLDQTSPMTIGPEAFYDPVKGAEDTANFQAGRLGVEVPGPAPEPRIYSVNDLPAYHAEKCADVDYLRHFVGCLVVDVTTQERHRCQAIVLVPGEGFRLQCRIAFSGSGYSYVNPANCLAIPD